MWIFIFSLGRCGRVGLTSPATFTPQPSSLTPDSAPTLPLGQGSLSPEAHVQPAHLCTPMSPARWVQAGTRPDPGSGLKRPLTAGIWVARGRPAWEAGFTRSQCRAAHVGWHLFQGHLRCGLSLRAPVKRPCSFLGPRLRGGGCQGGQSEGPRTLGVEQDCWEGGAEFLPFPWLLGDSALLVTYLEGRWRGLSQVAVGA